MLYYLQQYAQPEPDSDILKQNPFGWLHRLNTNNVTLEVNCLKLRNDCKNNCCVLSSMAPHTTVYGGFLI